MSLSKSNTANKTEGMMENAEGHFVPVDLVKPIDQQRDESVTNLVEKALRLQESIAKFKQHCMDEVQNFIDLSAMEYDITIGGVKGNVTLTSYNGAYKIVRSIQEFITFDERLQVAKELIDKCIHRWSDGARSEIRILVQDAFQTDKQGKINTTRVLSLRRLNITDEEWKQAMAAISDSIQMTGSKTYIRFYERIGRTDQYKPIPLDIAAL